MFIEHIEVADEFITSKNTDFTRFFIIEPRHTGRLKKQIWVEKTLSRSPGSVARCWLKNHPDVLIKQAQSQPQKLQTSPNYNPKFAIKLAALSEGNHHYLIAVAVFVQHTTEISYKATSNIQNNK